MKGSGNEIIKMPELFVFARVFILGVVCAEVFRLAFYLGERFSEILDEVDSPIKLFVIFFSLIICLMYMSKRGAFSASVRLFKSRRYDLFLAVLIGIWADFVIAPFLNVFHEVFQQASPEIAPIVMCALLLLLVSAIVRGHGVVSPKETSQLYFLADEEITSYEQDVFNSSTQAKAFAETVLASNAHSGLIFGIDGPWGVGKTSFVNLAEQHWLSKKDDSIIIFRFEPLRFASDADISERFINELSLAIQKDSFVPEFRPISSRYTRVLKGKADISFFGFKVSLEPSNETLEELLEDIDDVLKKARKKVIVVIDDLDRLDAKVVNNILFTVRRTFRLTQATYILCYDTENLISANGEGEKAREFLEKFVAIKLSLFVDSLEIKRFLEQDWASEQHKLSTVPSSSMLKLSAIVAELANALAGAQAARYMPLVGNLRKVKRFINALLLLQFERADFKRSDFNQRDVLNLTLLHLNYPGVFRDIYAEETEGRSGIFSLRQSLTDGSFTNTEDFINYLAGRPVASQFLLRELFGVDELGFKGLREIVQDDLRSRACFNRGRNRNLEQYLKLIVRFVLPQPRETFALYRGAVERILKGDSISVVLSASEFSLSEGENAQAQFWDLLISKAQTLNAVSADESIKYLVAFLPCYSSLGSYDRGLRIQSVYSLVRLLDQAGWSGAGGRRIENRPEHIVEIAQRIFGEGKYVGQGLLASLVSSGKGILGWRDLILFRLLCSADRSGQLYNLQSSLILNEDLGATTAGVVSELAVTGMRRITQEVFSMFKAEFIDPCRNILNEINDTDDDAFLGESKNYFLLKESKLKSGDEKGLDMKILEARSALRVFILYQLCSCHGAEGSGVGGGFYDESGRRDMHGISKKMNSYFFDICFNPRGGEKNIYHFVDHCLSHIDGRYVFGGEQGEYSPSAVSVLGGLDPRAMKKYWAEHRTLFLDQGLSELDRVVVTSNFIATYRDDLPKIFIVLDELLGD